MQTKYGVEIAPEDANEWLRIYADFYLVFAGSGGRRSARHTSAQELRPAAADLINSTLNENEAY